MLDRVTIERMVRWTGERPVLIALSGGGDSVALLRLLVVELGAERIRAAVVDHALREGSAEAAMRAVGIAESIGVRAEVLAIEWAEGANRAQQAARWARYRAICEHARANHINTIAVAHTADDQAETVLMRAANGSTWRGLAGIAPFTFAPVWPEGRGIAIARPLLGTRREALRGHLQELGATWIEDPANANPQFERVRVRERLHRLKNEGLDSMRLARLAGRLRRRADELDCVALDLICHAVQLGLVTHIDRAKWEGATEVKRRALQVLLAGVSGAAREPPQSEIAPLEQRIMRNDYRGGTCAGVEFTPTEDCVALHREAGAVLGRADGTPALPPIALSKEEETIWDGRLAVTPPESGWRMVPARNRERVAFENGLSRKRYSEVEGRLLLRPLVADRVAHAFAPDINRAKP